jgi:Na+-transporting methylmalonyl-CoA/oxaloacetate decarboxylase gamma subunit
MSELIQRAMELPWAYIMFTLIIRFVGVFIVLAVLMGGMYLLGFVVSRLIARQEEKKAEKHEQDEESIPLAEEPERDVDEEEIVAAIGAAIAMSAEPQHAAATSPAKGAAMAGAWAMAGRTTQMNRRLQGGSYRRS